MINTDSQLQQTIFDNGSHYFKSLLEDIDSAKYSIDLETYIFNVDDLAEKVATALINAARRGVNVRLLVDGAGTSISDDQFTQKLERAGIQIRIFHPFPWRFWQWSRSYVRVPFLLKAIYLFLKINSRNHRKVCIIDQTTAYIGSFNISKVHLDKNEGGDGWRDTGVKITGINLQELINAFNGAWNHMPIQERIQDRFRPFDLDPIIRLNNTRHRRRRFYKNLLEKITQCQTRIWMTNAYFVPDNFLLKHLTDAAARGVDVRIVLPQKSDVFFMALASSAFYRSLLKSGVRIFEYLPSMLHTKNLILDNWMIIGSSNLNHRSLLHDLEVDIHICTPAAQHEIEDQFLEDIKNSQEIHLKDWQKRPLFQRWLGRLLLYLRYWI